MNPLVVKKLDPILSKELTTLKKATSDLPAVIKTPGEYKVIEIHQKLVHSLIKSIEKWYDKTIDPLKRALKDLNTEKKLALLEPQTWEDSAKKLIEDYYSRKEEEAEKERKRLQARLDKEASDLRKREMAALKKSGDKEGAVALKAAPVIAAIAEVSNTASLDGRSFRDDLDVEVLNINEVPEEYVKKELRLQEVKNAFFKNDVRDIPGLKLTPTKTLVNR